MANIETIENFLNISVENKTLRYGKKRQVKNQYYFFKNRFYIVKLTKNHFMILDDSPKTKRLLRKYCWCSDDGYGKTRVYGSLKSWHKLYLNYDEGLVADHLNRNRFDNRPENLRIVTYRENSRNLTKNSKNTSGKPGVCKNNMGGIEYWMVRIYNNNSKVITKLFSIKKLGDAEAFRQAVVHRKELEIEFGYLGD